MPEQGAKDRCAWQAGGVPASQGLCRGAGGAGGGVRLVAVAALNPVMWMNA